uniref:NADH-ubiquinone oxidoreductase chain 1 n=1 Tax=Byturus ochraceus TaxID=153018 RepID=A0A343A3Q9_9CUCU|nr:NADH dehydrogenase subunit 1 [Byturus ochraceus]AOY39187.1 NADH dehydrogenase subunit 1 [Byturus ochraceus]
MLLFISMFVLLICVLISVAFLTLLERKVLGYIQIRKGPNKVGFLGILQPFGDAIKLFTKEQVYPFMSNFNIYYLCPIINLFLALFLWMAMPFIGMLFSFNYSILFFLVISSLSVYTIMLAGWSSNSNYSLIGGLRSVAQTISYEVSLALILMSFLFLIMDFNISSLMKYQKYSWFLFLCLPLCLMWFVSSLAETNRTPFDFAEGESELVSGFNVEYSSGGFALIFLAEYASILFMSMLCSMMFLGGNFNSWLFFLKLLFMSFLWLWVRGTLPRYRYDKLMYLTWKSYLPVSLNFLMFYIGLILFNLSNIF